VKTFFCSTKVYSGSDALDVLKLYHAKRVMIVTDRFLSENGMVNSIRDSIPAAEVLVFDKVTPDPTLSLVAKGAACCKEFRPELLIALGGGSPIDCAKAIFLAAELTVPFVVIPTTSGSGSDMTSFSILTHDGTKHPLIDGSLRPTVSILDDRFLNALPQSLIADSGMDLIAHCMEAFVAVDRCGFTDALSGYALQSAMKNLSKSYLGDCSVRKELHEAASMAGLAFDQAGLGVCHALAHTIGGVFHIPHGRLCAMLLPAVMQYNASTVVEQYALAARFCGITCATDYLAMREMIRRFELLRQMMKLPENLKQAGVSQSAWFAAKDEIMIRALQDACCRTNPVPVTLDALERICKAVAP